MANWDDVSAPSATPQGTGGWDAVSSVTKVPDMSGIEKDAAANVSSNKGGGHPLDVATGSPVTSMLSGNKDAGFSRAMRGHLVDQYNKGAATDGAGFMQSALLSVMPYVADIAYPVKNAKDTAVAIGDAAISGAKSYVSAMAYPLLPEQQQQDLMGAGDISPDKTFQNTDSEQLFARQFAQYAKPGESIVNNTHRDAVYSRMMEDTANPVAQNMAIQNKYGASNVPEPTTLEKLVHGFAQGERGTLGSVMGGVYAVAAAPLAPLFERAMGVAQEAVQRGGATEGQASLIPEATGVAMDMLGVAGAKHFGKAFEAERNAKRIGPLPVTGPWDAVKGGDVMKKVAADILKQPVESMSSSHIDNFIGEKMKGVAPVAQDFRDVAQVSGVPEPVLHTIYVETGKRPEQVFSDAQKDPQVATDLAVGKIPSAYEALIEPSQVPAEKLSVAPSETENAFSVIDHNGDYVHGGFDSAEEARHHIEDRKFAAEERAAIQSEAASPVAAVDKTTAGNQTVIPGAEKITDRALAERKMAEPMKGGAAPVDGGLFDVAGRGQGDIFDAPARVVKAEPAINKPLPKELSKSAPRYNYGSKEFTLVFKSGIDHAVYIVSGKGASKAHAKFSEFLKNNGYDDARIAKEGQKIRDNIKSLAAKSAPGNLEIGESAVKQTSVKSNNTIPPAEVGKPTSLRTFLMNNGAKINEAGEILSIKQNGSRISGEAALEHANDIAKEHGYLPKDESKKPAAQLTVLKNHITETNGGREAFRAADADRVVKAAEALNARKNADPAFVELEAHRAGIDTDRLSGETEKQYTKRLVDALTAFYKNQEGSVSNQFHQKAIQSVILAAEKYTGKLTGDLFPRLAEGYIRTFQPELMGPKAKRADAFLAKYKTAKQEAENSFYRQSNEAIRGFDKMTDNQKLEWLYDHETGRWNEEENPDHARFQALLDATHKAEIGSGASEAGYKHNYLPHVWEKPDAVSKYFKSDAYIKKFGADGFTKRSQFQLIQDGIRAGFKLKTNNPERMLVTRLLAGQDMMRTMDLLHDMESSGIATPAKSFTVEKRIQNTQAELEIAKKKYTEADAKLNPPAQDRADFAAPASSKYLNLMKERIDTLTHRLSELEAEAKSYKKDANHADLKKNSFKILGPDNKVWNVHQEVGALWKSAMDSKGLWENQGVTGDAYRAYMQGKAAWISNKLALSLFHPAHEVVIHLASGSATAAEHLIKGGKFSDLDFSRTSLKMGMGGEGLNPLRLQDHPGVKAWNTHPDARTPEQTKIVQTMVEGGFKPTMSARDTVHFRDNFDKGISKLGVNNLRLLGSAVQVLGKASAPLFEHWIPALKTDSYMQRTDLAMKRDPSLANDAGRRAEVFRAIAKDVDRNYGEMNQDTRFWNKTVGDAFDAAFLSGGWKLAMLQNFRGLLEPAKLAYNYAKTGEFSKEKISHQMLQSYFYTANTLITGALLTYMMTGTVGSAIDWAFPNTGDQNPDGSAIRLAQPAFLKEGFMLNRDINEEGLFGGTGKFLYHASLIPGIADTLQNHDFIGREIISNPTDAHQWAHAGWEFISPITVSSYDKADAKGSDAAVYANIAGFPLAGAYIDQSEFEQKVIHTYSKQYPPTGDVYTAYLKQSLKTAIRKGDDDGAENIKEEMKAQGMDSSQIYYASKENTTPFTEIAWEKLKPIDQKRLLESATEAEREKYRVGR